MLCHSGNPTFVIGDPVNWDLGKQASGLTEESIL